MKHNHYPLPQILLHWAVVIAVIVAYFAIFAHMYTLHFAAGITVLTLAIVRIAFLIIFKKRKPAVEPPLSKGQHIVGTLVKIALALVFILIPVSGVLFRYFNGRDLVLYGHLLLKGAMEKSPMLASTFHSMHVYLGLIALALIALHLLGALYNFVVVRNNVLQRMLPFMYRCNCHNSQTK